MKKIFTFIFAIALSLNVFAQCPLTTAVDFTATDCHGTEVHLFDILDGGQYVLVDFFFASCNPCQQATPKVVESYYAFGCNMHDVYYVEISDRDSDAVCQNWVNTYGVEYPTIGGPAGGATICTQYQIGAFPTVILIAPDRSIVINDLWPINNAQTVISALESHGIQQHDCEPGPTGEVTFSTDIVECYWGCLYEPGMFTIYNQTTEDLVIEDYFSDDFYNIVCTDSWNDLTPGNDIKGMTIAPSDSLDVWVFVNYYKMSEGFLKLITSFGEYELKIVLYGDGSVDEHGANNFTLYPNPVNESLMISGQNLGNIRIFNTLGQVIFEVFATDDLNINTSGFENGIYFVKVGDKTQKFVVTH